MKQVKMDQKIEQGTMQAVAVEPGKPQSGRLIKIPRPSPNEEEVLVKVFSIGIDGTDVEIDQAEYGEAPKGERYLVIGHESLGKVISVGKEVKDFKAGEWVVATVRRPDDCDYCRTDRQDFCVTGNYTERGIKGAHGFLSEYYTEQPKYLIKVPEALGESGVLIEPLSIVEKGIRQAWTLQKRLGEWRPKKVLILGAGPIGLMAAMLTRLKEVETIVYAKDANATLAEIVSQIGATYLSLEQPNDQTLPLDQLAGRYGPFDFILEATGSEKVAFGAMEMIGLNGVLCLTSVTGGEKTLEISISRLNLGLVLGNRTVFGTVNASRIDFEEGVKDLLVTKERWPGWLERLITRRVSMADFRQAFERKPGDLKVIVEVK